jgi:hypothetical protein
MTIKEFFEQAKSDGHEWADAAIVNMTECPKQFTWTNKVESISGAIFNGFSWRRSKEGFEYWDRIWDENGGRVK